MVCKTAFAFGVLSRRPVEDDDLCCEVGFGGPGEARQRDTDEILDFRQGQDHGVLRAAVQILSRGRYLAGTEAPRLFMKTDSPQPLQAPMVSRPVSFCIPRRREIGHGCSQW